MNKANFRKIGFSLALLLVLFMLFLNLKNTDWTTTIGPEWAPCLDYFGEGGLYSGQLICAYGPVYFGIGWLFKIQKELLSCGFDMVHKLKA